MKYNFLILKKYIYTHTNCYFIYSNKHLLFSLFQRNLDRNEGLRCFLYNAQKAFSTFYYKLFTIAFKLFVNNTDDYIRTIKNIYSSSDIIKVSKRVKEIKLTLLCNI